MEWFIDFSVTNKIDNLTCAIIHNNLTCADYHETHLRLLLYFCGAIAYFFYIINRTIHGCLEIYEIISGVEEDISLVRFAHS